MSANFYTGLTDEQLEYEFTLDKRSFKEAGVVDYAPKLKNYTPNEFLRVGKWYYNRSHKFGCNKALEWFFKADSLGDLRAPYLIGRIYFKSGTQVDYQYAFKLFKKCASADYNSYTHDSEFFLGEMCAEGKGVEKDMETALIWYTKAASGNHRDAQLRTGLIYASTPNDRESVKKAYFWLSKLAKQNNEEAIKLLEKLKKDVDFDIEELVCQENPYPSLPHMLNENSNTFSKSTYIQEFNEKKDRDSTDKSTNKEMSKYAADNESARRQEKQDVVNNVLSKPSTHDNLEETVQMQDIHEKRKIVDIDGPSYRQSVSKKRRNDSTNDSYGINGSTQEHGTIQESAHKKTIDKDELTFINNNSAAKERKESNNTKNLAFENRQKDTNNIDINKSLSRKTIAEELEAITPNRLSINRNAKKSANDYSIDGSFTEQDYIGLDDRPDPVTMSTSNTHVKPPQVEARDLFSILLSDISENQATIRKLQKQRKNSGKKTVKAGKVQKDKEKLGRKLYTLESLFYHIANNPVNNLNLDRNDI